MAGAVKHMERSHRSHNRAQQYGIFNQFHRNAYKVSTYKAQKKTAIQKLGAMLKKALPKTSSK